MQALQFYRIQFLIGNLCSMLWRVYDTWGEGGGGDKGNSLLTKYLCTLYSVHLQCV